MKFSLPDILASKLSLNLLFTRLHLDSKTTLDKTNDLKLVEPSLVSITAIKIAEFHFVP